MARPTEKRTHNSLIHVAKAAGVSVATVSRVLNGSNKELWAKSAARADKIRSIAKELGYVPDWRARALRSGRTHSIGVVYSGTNPMRYAQSYMPMFSGFGEVVQAAGYHLLFIDVPATEGADLPVSVLQSVEAIVYFHKVTDLMRPAAGLVKGPTLLLNCDSDLPAATVTPDDVGGATVLTRHLLDLGHRRVLFIDLCRPDAHFDHFSRRVRQNTVRQVMADAGHGSGFDLWEYDIDTPLGEIVARYQRLPAAKRPTAVVYPYGMSGLLLLNAFVRAGVRIPADLSLAVFDDHELVAGAIVPLTTVDVPFEKMGRAGADIVLRLLDVTPPPARRRKIVLPEQLIVRESTARPRRTPD